MESNSPTLSVAEALTFRRIQRFPSGIATATAISVRLTARALFLSPGTVRNHLAAITQKLGARVAS